MAIDARFLHRCTHVLDKHRSIDFYEKALGFHVVRESSAPDGSWTNTYLATDACPFQIELTWNRGRTEPYDNGGQGEHIAFSVDDFEAAHKLHQEMGVIEYENPTMGLYFITDPEGCRIEILPAHRGEDERR